jgi:hypothetical protein
VFAAISFHAPQRLIPALHKVHVNEGLEEKKNMEPQHKEIDR